MARELLSESRFGGTSTPADAYGAVANEAIGHIIERWNKGHGAPGDNTHIRNVHVHDEGGEHIGFRLYLVWNEPPRYGRPEIEVVTK